MKVSINWIKQFTEVDLATDELVQKIGEQLGAVEEVIDIGAKYQGLHIVKVVSAEKHPNADKLSVCLVDDGGAVKDVERNKDNLIEVVCGAPNVQAGMLAVWLPPGATVPASYDKEPFVLEARELRGVVSNGMLASASELAIGDEHTGIVAVDVGAQPGEDFAEVYELNDIVLDIENKMFTHRPDCFGILGVARELAGITGKQFTSPKWYRELLEEVQPKADKLSLIIDNQIPDKVPRFTAIALSDISIKPSPFIMRSYLARVGIRPINNIVDATNYLMVLTGQPLHAYDADKLQALAPESQKTLQLEARLSRRGESLQLLDGKTITFDDEETILITSYDKPVSIGGVMGGLETEVDEQTTRIVLECANFDMYSIRRASMRHGIFTDAVTRFNKGQSPHQTDRVLREAIATIEYVAGAGVASTMQDEAAKLGDNETIWITPAFIEKRLGKYIGADQIQKVLGNVEFSVHKDADGLQVQAPFWRTDIAIAEDVVEEIGRLIGFDKIPLVLPRRSVAPVDRNQLVDLKYRIREILASAGANEVLTYSFVHGRLLEAAGQDTKTAYRLINAISPDLQYYRLSLTPSLLEKVHANIKAGHGAFALFELGKTHQKLVMDETEAAVPAERELLSLVFAADDKTWAATYDGAAYYQARQYLDRLCSELGVAYSIQPIANKADSDDEAADVSWAPYDENRSGLVIVADKAIGAIGEPRRQVARRLKLPVATASLELDTELLQKYATGKRYQQLSKYPSISQDISLKLPADLTYTDVVQCIDASIPTSKHVRYQVIPIDMYQPEKDASSKHMAFRVTAVSDRKTMTDAELSAVLDTIAMQANTELSAERL